MAYKTKSSVLVTGAGGFVGRATCAALEEEGHMVRRIIRGDADNAGVWTVSDLASDDIPDDAFDGVDVVIHLAASMPGQKGDPEGTKTAQMAHRVATSVRKHQVKRSILLSSVGVRLLEGSNSKPRPYTLQKRDAEIAFLAALGPSNQCVTLRPPVMYGEGMRGSFALLLGLVQRGAPLPVKSATAPRCYLSVSNLTGLLVKLVSAPEEQWQSGDRKAFEPHDGPATSTQGLVRMLADTLERKARTFSLPRTVVQSAGKALGKGDQVDAIFNPLICKDHPSLSETFGWEPDEHMPQSLAFLRV